jgi:RNA polymerase sigma factor (sigma-70 family)
MPITLRRRYLEEHLRWKPRCFSLDRPMPDELSFEELIARVRSGDQAASRTLLERYGGAVRRVARMRIRHAMLSGQYDSVDIFQSVMRSFLMRVKKDDNDWQLDTPEQLLNLLLDMTDNTVVDKIRAATAEKRGGGERPGTIDVDPRDPKGHRPVEDELATKELAAQCWDKLSADGQRLFRLYFIEQMEWSEVAELEGSTAEACRKKLERAFENVAKQFPSQERGDA